MEINTPDKKYRTTDNLVYSCQYHVIFCPKFRRSVLVDGIDIRLNELLVEKQKEYGYVIIELEIMPDHVHLLLDANPQIGIISIIAKIKRYASSTLRKEFPILKRKLPCLWTRHKFISTVGVVSLNTVKQYIIDQKGK